MYNDFETMYPEIHRRLMPFVDEVVDNYEGGENLDEQTLGQMADYVVSRAGILNDPPRGHNRFTSDDFARYLILCRLTGFCPPVFFPPVFPVPPIGFVPRPPVRPRPPFGGGRPPHGGGRPSHGGSRR